VTVLRRQAVTPARAPEVERFVKELAAENRAFWVGRDVRLDPGAPPVVLLSQIRHRV
jgi:hypothetical protein